MNGKKPIKCYMKTEPCFEALLHFINDNIERDDGTPVQLRLFTEECLVSIADGKVSICGTFPIEE